VDLDDPDPVGRGAGDLPRDVVRRLPTAVGYREDAAETPIGGLAADGPYSAELKRQWGIQGNHEGEAAGLLDAYLTAERERAEERARVLVA
jgi:hypothetical protein